jgi:hypothetical protein
MFEMPFYGGIVLTVFGIFVFERALVRDKSLFEI